MCLALQTGVDLRGVEVVVGDRCLELRHGQPGIALAELAEVPAAGLPGGDDFPDLEAGPGHHSPAVDKGDSGRIAPIFRLRGHRRGLLTWTTARSDQQYVAARLLS